MYPYNMRRNNKSMRGQQKNIAKPFMVFAENNSCSGNGCNNNNNNDSSHNNNNNQENVEILPPDDSEQNSPGCDEISRYVIEMIKEGIKDKCSGAKFYDALANMAEDENCKRILHKIHHDEEKNKKIFIEIYKILLGVEPSPEDLECECKTVSQNMMENFENAFFDEINAIDFYRKLYFVFLNQEIRDALFEIITDEQSHAMILNYLISKSI